MLLESLRRIVMVDSMASMHFFIKKLVEPRSFVLQHCALVEMA